MIARILILLSGVLILASCQSDSNRRNTADAQIEKRIDELISRMTVEEKIGQTNQLTVYGTTEELCEKIRNGEIGSLLNVVDPADINTLQRAAVEQSRLGIPLLIARDVIHGFRTVFPIPLGQAATFDPALVEQGAHIAAIEASAAGIRWTFSPMLDISRDPRWGRIAESAGEDPCLTSAMGAAMVRGYQGEGADDPTSIAACAKHFVGYGASESGRDYNSTNLTERQLRNVYLPPFEQAVRNGAMTLMTSFNDNDGIPSTGNRFLLEEVLRNEWGFDGMVVTDWNSAGEMVSHGFAADTKDAAMKAINVGVDMDMMSHVFSLHLKDLIDEGTVDERRLDEAVRNILRVKFRLGLFENPYIDTARIARVTYAPEHLEAARRTAEESAVLLRNEGNILPLDASALRSVLVAGPMADAPAEQLGTWTFDGEPDHTVTPLAAIRAAYGDRLHIGYNPVAAYSREKVTAAKLAAFTAQAASYDAILLFVGEEAILSGEAHCLADLNLQGSQSELIAAARRSGKPVVTVVMAGRPLTIARDLANTDALLYSFHPGTMGGPALIDLIFGNAVPSGKLPVTFPVATGQIPIYYARNMTGRPAAGNELLLDEIPVGAGQTSLGCTSYHLDAGFGPLFPFGFGLSYTTFEYADLQLDKEAYLPTETIRASCRLTNTGKRTATEVVQLYVRDRVGSTVRPVKELKAFDRITLEPGQSRTVEFELPAEDLAFWGLDMQKRVEPGTFDLWIAGDSQSGNSVTFTIN